MLCMLTLTAIAIAITFPAIKEDMKDHPAGGVILWLLSAGTLVMFIITFRTLYRRWIGAVSTSVLTFQSTAAEPESRQEDDPGTLNSSSMNLATHNMPASTV